MLNLIDCNAFEKLRRDSSRTAALSRLSLKGDFAPLGACPRKGLSHLPCKNKKPPRWRYFDPSGEGGIRTLERLASLTVFETAPFNHSGTSPNQASLIIQHFQKFRESPAKKSGPAAVFRDWEAKRYAENPIQPVNTPADPP